MQIIQSMNAIALPGCKQPNQYTRGLALTTSRSDLTVINNIIVTLLIAEAILAGTIFNASQIVIELILIAILGFRVTRLKLSRIDVVLLAVLLSTQIVSVILNDIFTFMLNAKLVGISILVFIYFKHTYFKTKLIEIVFLINLVVVLHQLFSGSFFIEDTWFIGQWAGITKGRPMGLFLNTHLTGGFVAVYLIYISNMRRLYFLDFVLLFYIHSLFNLVAYGCQTIANIKGVRYVLNKINPVFILSLIFLAVFLFDDHIADFATRWHLRDDAVKVLIAQITDLQFYEGIWTLYPINYADFCSAQTNRLGMHNEMEFVAIFVKSGIVLASVVLFVFIKHLKHYRIFIMVTLFHYGFLITSPLILYMMMTYNHDIDVKTSGMLKKSSRRNVVLVLLQSIHQKL